MRAMDSPRTLRTPADLAAAELAPASPALEKVAARYAVAITPAMTDLIRGGAASDPIARQFVPSREELFDAPGEDADPIGDDVHSPVEGVVHRYPDRVLLKLVHVCAVYCRFCFRRTMVGPGKRKSLAPRALETALAYIRAHDEIWEVILTGGDPLMLSPARLRKVMGELRTIEHIKVVRLHTRIPAVEPKRVTRELVSALSAARKATYVVLHANHPREMTAAALAACARIVDAGLPMLSQSVLLRGVNDDAATLEALMRSFVAARIKPYYLHHGDLAPGTAHLRTTIEEGQAVVGALLGRASGLCQPAYVLDIPGGHGKSPIGPTYLSGGPEGYAVRDWQGISHRYRDRVRHKKKQP